MADPPYGRFVGALVVLALLALATAPWPATAAENAPAPARQKALIYLLRQDCGACHGITLKGSLGPSLLPEALAGKPDDTLVDIILGGVPGTPMPPWGVEITRHEAAWLVRQLKKGIRDER